MTQKINLSLVPLLIVSGIIAYYIFAQVEQGDGAKVFKTVHLVNFLDEENAEAELTTIIVDFNRALAETGYTDSQMTLWKKRSDEEGIYTFFFEATWPDKATYDKAHEHEKYQAVYKKHRARYLEMVKEEVYGRYVPLN